MKVLEGRRNVFLMGDTIGDASMVDGMVDIGAVIKVGFLYDHVSIMCYIKRLLSIVIFLILFHKFYVKCFP